MIDDIEAEFISHESLRAVGDQVKMKRAVHTSLFHRGLDEQVAQAFASSFGCYGQHAQKGVVFDMLDGNACRYFAAARRRNDQKLIPRVVERSMRDSGAVEKMAELNFVARPRSPNRVAEAGKQQVVQPAVVP